MHNRGNPYDVPCHLKKIISIAAKRNREKQIKKNNNKILLNRTESVLIINPSNVIKISSEYTHVT